MIEIFVFVHQDFDFCAKGRAFMQIIAIMSNVVRKGIYTKGNAICLFEIFSSYQGRSKHVLMRMLMSTVMFLDQALLATCLPSPTSPTAPATATPALSATALRSVREPRSADLIGSGNQLRRCIRITLCVQKVGYCFGFCKCINKVWLQ